MALPPIDISSTLRLTYGFLCILLVTTPNDKAGSHGKAKSAESFPLNAFSPGDYRFERIVNAMFARCNSILEEKPPLVSQQVGTRNNSICSLYSLSFCS